MFVTSARQICFHGHFTVCFVLNSKQRPMLSQSFVPCLLSAQEKSSQACWHGTPPPPRFRSQQKSCFMLSGVSWWEIHLWTQAGSLLCYLFPCCIFILLHDRCIWVGAPLIHSTAFQETPPPNYAVWGAPPPALGIWAHHMICHSPPSLHVD